MVAEEMHLLELMDWNKCCRVRLKLRQHWDADRAGEEAPPLVANVNQAGHFGTQDILSCLFVPCEISYRLRRNRHNGRCSIAPGLGMMCRAIKSLGQAGAVEVRDTNGRTTLHAAIHFSLEQVTTHPADPGAREVKLCPGLSVLDHAVKA